MAFLAGGIRDAQRVRGASHVDPDQAGETLPRLFASFVLLDGDAQAIKNAIASTD